MVFQDVISALKHGRLEEKIAVLDEVRLNLNLIVEGAFQAIGRSEAPIVLVDKLYQLGSIVLPLLEEEFLKREPNFDRVLIATLLTQFGSHSGVEVLLNTIRTDAEHQHLAAISFAKAGVKEASGVIIESLRRATPDFYTKRENSPSINTFLSSLELLGADLPRDLKRRFTAPDVPEDIAHFIK